MKTKIFPIFLILFFIIIFFIFYKGLHNSNIYVPKNKGTSVLSSVGELVISGLISINASDYIDTFSCKPRVGEVSGPVPIEVEDRSHFLGIVSCAFSANS